RVSRADEAEGRSGLRLRRVARTRRGGGARIEIAKRATAERDDASLDVHHGEHQAVAEAIVVARARRPRNQKTDGLGSRRRHALRTEKARETVPARRGVTDAEGLEDFVDVLVRARLEPALFQLLERVVAMLV